jgi:hypothetical protein
MIAALLLGVSMAVSADPVAETGARQSAAELVRQLGDSSFKARQKASEELERLGVGALDALRKGVDSPDPEISDRCRRLLPRAVDLHLHEQLGILVGKREAPVPEDLPGIKRWIKIAGAGKESRELYASVFRERCKTLIEVEEEPDRGAMIFQEFCREVQNRTQADSGGSDDQVGHAELVLYFFLGGDAKCGANIVPIGPPRFRFDPFGNTFLSSRRLEAMLSGESSNGAAKKIFLSWLQEQRRPQTLRRGMQIAAAAELAGAASVALRIADDKIATPNLRSNALLDAAKLFRAEHVKDLEALMSERISVNRRGIVDGAASTELGDIALGLAVQVTGQSMDEYGFERFQIASSYLSYALTGDQRETAAKKWTEWRESHKK